jgi:hypothetical protein
MHNSNQCICRCILSSHSCMLVLIKTNMLGRLWDVCIRSGITYDVSWRVAENLGQHGVAIPVLPHSR